MFNHYIHELTLQGRVLSQPCMKGMNKLWKKWSEGAKLNYQEFHHFMSILFRVPIRQNIIQT